MRQFLQSEMVIFGTDILTITGMVMATIHTTLAGSTGIWAFSHTAHLLN